MVHWLRLCGSNAGSMAFNPGQRIRELKILHAPWCGKTNKQTTNKQTKQNKIEVKAWWKSLSRVQFFATPWTIPWNSPGQNTGVGSLSLLQGIFPTQGSNPGLPHCREILYQLSHNGSPKSTVDGEKYKNNYCDMLLIVEAGDVYTRRQRILSSFSGPFSLRDHQQHQ